MFIIVSMQSMKLDGRNAEAIGGAVAVVMSVVRGIADVSFSSGLSFRNIVESVVWTETGP